jgi:hypothetical protein
MTIQSFVGKLARYFSRFLSWLYSGYRWGEWELLTIAIVALVPLLLIVRQLRKGTARKVYADQIRERPRIIGVKLADHKQSHPGIRDSKKDRPAHAPRGDGKRRKRRKKRTKELEKSHEQIRQLQHEIIKRRQTEVRLESKIIELTATNEQLQHKSTEHKQIDERLKQKAVELPAANGQLRNKVVEHKQAREHLEQQTAEVRTADEKLQDGVTELRQAKEYPKQQVAADKPLQQKVAEHKQTEEPIRRQAAEVPTADKRLQRRAAKRRQADDGMLRENTEKARDPRELTEPLDIQKLKAIAALAKQIQGRSRHG